MPDLQLPRNHLLAPFVIMSKNGVPCRTLIDVGSADGCRIVRRQGRAGVHEGLIGLGSMTIPFLGGLLARQFHALWIPYAVAGAAVVATFIVGGSSVGVCVFPATQASIMSAHSWSM